MTLSVLVLPAHLGHVAVVAGHTHWAAGAAIGVAAAITIWGVLSGQGKRSTDSEAGPEVEHEDYEESS
ncbi:MAG: DUF6732 family protein [Pseudomonadota bacterium]